MGVRKTQGGCVTHHGRSTSAHREQRESRTRWEKGVVAFPTWTNRWLKPFFAVHTRCHHLLGSQQAGQRPQARKPNLEAPLAPLPLWPTHLVCRRHRAYDEHDVVQKASGAGRLAGGSHPPDGPGCPDSRSRRRASRCRPPSCLPTPTAGRSESFCGSVSPAAS